MTRVAEALAPVLSVFHSISGQALQAVWQIQTEGSLDRLLRTRLIVSAPVFDVIHLEPWSSFIGRSFGWGWVTVNQQGYCDGLLLSFEGIVPQLVLNVIASSIKGGMITKV